MNKKLVFKIYIYLNFKIEYKIVFKSEDSSSIG